MPISPSLMPVRHGRLHVRRVSFETEEACVRYPTTIRARHVGRGGHNQSAPCPGEPPERTPLGALTGQVGAMPALATAIRPRLCCVGAEERQFGVYRMLRKRRLPRDAAGPLPHGPTTARLPDGPWSARQSVSARNHKSPAVTHQPSRLKTFPQGMITKGGRHRQRRIRWSAPAASSRPPPLGAASAAHRPDCSPRRPHPQGESARGLTPPWPAAIRSTT